MRQLVREALTLAETAIDRDDRSEAVVHVVRAVRLLEQSQDILAPTIAQATTRELLLAILKRAERDTMYSSVVRQKMASLLGLLPEGSDLNEPDAQR